MDFRLLKSGPKVLDSNPTLVHRSLSAEVNPRCTGADHHHTEEYRMRIAGKAFLRLSQLLLCFPVGRGRYASSQIKSHDSLKIAFLKETGYLIQTEEKSG